MASKANSKIKSVVELQKVLDPKARYTRQQVAEHVGCIWANVLDASRGKNPKLKGERVKEGKTQRWEFTGAQVLEWRTNVETRTSGGPRLTLVGADDAEVQEMRAIIVKAFKGTKFESKL